MAAIATDTFTRADSGTLGANWTTTSTHSPLGIVSNLAASESAGDCSDFYSGTTWPNDQYSQAQHFALGTDFGSIFARVASAAETFYAFDLTGPYGAAVDITLYKKVATAFTFIIDLGTFSIGSGDMHRLEVQGTTLRGYTNGTFRGSQTDSAISSGSPGLHFNQVSATPAGHWDNWEGGDFTPISKNMNESMMTADQSSMMR